MVLQLLSSFKASIYNTRSKQSKISLDSLISSVKRDSASISNQFDCVVGLSGGVDSSYVLHHCVSLGLKPLAVTMDNGWNDTTANANIKNICSELGVTLISHVIDWEEYLHMLKAFLWADVIDIEVLYDNACQGVCFHYASQYNIRHILSGSNSETEGMRCPEGWSWFKTDKTNIINIIRAYERFHNLPKYQLRTYPFISAKQRLWYEQIKGIKWVRYLDYIDYNKQEAIKILEEKYAYRKYPQKHYENVMTRVYQGYILPRKFHVDKNRWHLSIEVASNLITKAQAVDELRLANSYDWTSDINYVCEKLGFSREEFCAYIKRPKVHHLYYGTELRVLRKYSKALKLLKLLLKPKL